MPSTAAATIISSSSSTSGPLTTTSSAWPARSNSHAYNTPLGNLRPMQGSPRNSSGVAGAGRAASSAGAATTTNFCGAPIGTATMSSARRSPKRTPASKPLATMSSKPSSVMTSIFTPGWAFRKPLNNGANSRRAAGRGTFRRRLPRSVSRKSLTSSSAWSSSSIRRSTRAYKCAPASVGTTLRVVRFNRRMPSRVSSARIAWLSEDAVTLRSSAALRKLRWRATAANICSSFKSGRMEEPVRGLLNLVHGCKRPWPLGWQGAQLYHFSIII